MAHHGPGPDGGGRAPLIVGLVVTAILVLSLGAVGIATRSTGGESPTSGPGTTSPSRSESPRLPTPEHRPDPPAVRSSPRSAPLVPAGACTPAQAIAALPLRQRLAQLLIVGVSATGTGEALSVVRSEQVGGIFLTGDAIELLTDGALARVQAAATIPLLVAVDDEGGRVQRVATLEGYLPSARTMAATMSPGQVYDVALERGQALASRGVTMNLAPVLDVSAQPDDAVIGDRSFSSDPEVVIRYADAFAQGMRDAGVLPVFKHFPGHGRASGDSHLGPVTTPPLSELARVDLVPYRALLGSGQAAVMLGHLQVPGLTESGIPASLSPAAVSLLREEFGFDGLIITDDLYAMDAIRDRYTLAEATRAALSAGVDMALMINGDRLDAVLDYLEYSVTAGALPESRVNEAVARVLEAKDVDPCALRGGPP